MDSYTISTQDIIDTLKTYVNEYDSMFTDAWLDGVYEFASELTGLSIDTLISYTESET